MSEKPAHAAPSDKESLDAADIAAESEAWTKLAEMICGVDERKIRDCKEDMDAVLVFVSIHHRSLRITCIALTSDFDTQLNHRPVCSQRY